MRTIGRHILVDLCGCAPGLLDDLEGMRRELRRVADIIGAVVMGETFHRFSPQGVSGVLAIAESHISVHTWPECGYVAIDVYTCGLLDPWPGVRHLGVALGATEYRTQEIVRGHPGELRDLDRQMSERWLVTTVGDVNKSSKAAP